MAISSLRSRIEWKPSKDEQHLRTRIEYGHLEQHASLEDYHNIIRAIVNNPAAHVYAYNWQETTYPTVVGESGGSQWIVIFSLGGTMETAFPPDDPESYLADPRFQYLGTVEELLR